MTKLKSDPVSILKLLITNLTIITIATVAALSLGELFIRAYYPQELIIRQYSVWVPDKEMGWRHGKNLNVQLNAGEGLVTFATDNQGFRINSSLQNPAPSDFSILGLGDSFLEAIHVNNEETFAHLLGNNLSQRWNKKVRVTNTGVGAWDPNQYLEQARQSLGRDRYNLGLVFFYVDNDVVAKKITEFSPQTVVRDYKFSLPSSLELNQFVEHIFYPINNKLQSFSHLYVFLKTRLNVLLARLNLTAAYFPSIFLITEKNNPWWKTTADICLEIKKEFDAHNTPVIFVFIPAPYQVEQSEFDNYVAMFNLNKSEIDLEQPNKILAKDFADLGLEVIDLLGPLREVQKTQPPLYHKVHKHFSRAGHIAAANVLSAELDRLNK